MKIRYGIVLAVAIGLGFAGCASGGGTAGLVNIGGSGGNLVGENPRNTDNTRAAQQALRAAENAEDSLEAQMHYRDALSGSEAAIVEDGRNPLAHRLAAEASLGIGDYSAAGAHFDRAVELRPIYEFDMRELRERAWIDLYQRASPLVQSGDYEGAAAHFENANMIYLDRPEALVTLGQIYAQLGEHDKALENIDGALAFLDSEIMALADSATTAGWLDQTAGLPMLRAQVLAAAGRFEEAIGTYREMSAAEPGNVELKRGLAGILMEMGEEAEAFEIYEGMLDMPDLSAADFYFVGVGFYQGSDYTRAAQAFRGAAEASVNDRDAIEMWARSLQLDSAFVDIPPVAQRWAELDPHSSNALVILAQSSNLNGDDATTGTAIQAADALEVHMNDLVLRRFGDGGGSISGSVTNKKLDPGAVVSIVFTFYNTVGDPIGTVTESVSVGNQDMAEIFQVQWDSAEMIGGYGYRLTIG
jgi:tetratricopeptide (TPR) repeat protein